MDFFPQPVLHYNLPMFSLRIKMKIFAAIIGIAVTAGLTGCRANETLTPISRTPEATDTPQATATITPTPEPLALMVNGEGVPLGEYQAQLSQLAAADAQAGKTRPPEEQRQMVLDELINQTLMAQAARENGFTLDQAALQARIDELAAEAGGEQALNEWMAANGYTSESFRKALERAAASAWQRDEVINTVPETAEQVRVQQILVRDADTADEIHRQLEAGADFATLAAKYDPITSGVLGWFPRGYLTQPAVEDAAFALQPGQYSSVIESEFGYHIIYVLERETDRPLSMDARTTLQHKTLASWLEALKSAGSIEILAP